MSAHTASRPLTDANDPPESNEVEVSLFGPGVGESVVLHLGEGEWVIVDSCIDADSRRPAALDYLKRVGVNPADCVKLIVATHWHDDHVRGLSTVVREIPKAKFSCSAALQSKEFFSLIGSRGFSAVAGSDVEEMSAILRLRKVGGREDGGGVDYWASDSTRVFQKPATGESKGVQIFALSPSAAEITLAQLELAKLIPVRGAPKRRVASQTANEVAVALHVEIGELRILLGSDVETRPNTKVGWKAVIASTTRPATKAQTYKVAHHGSVTGHEPGVWTELLTDMPIAVVTPFSRSGLPKEADIERLLALSAKAFLSAPSQPAAVKRSPAVERTIASATTRFSRRDSKMGQIRLRWQRGHIDPDVQVFGTAQKI